MNQIDYYKILGLKPGATLDQIKKAYRKKARLYHPDLNTRKDAAEIFISVNEAYEYLSEKQKKLSDNSISQEEITKAWIRYRREQARKRAYEQSRQRFKDFSNSKTYRTSMVLNRAQIIINMTVSIFITFMAVFGYIMSWGRVEDGYDPPSVIGFIFLLSIGAIFFTVSLAHMLAFYQNKKKIESNEKS